MKLNIQLFSLIASDSKTVGSRYSSGNAYHYYAELIENSWDINTNKSNITVNFKAYGVNNYSYSSLSTPYATISVDGEQKTRQNVTYINKGSGNERTICSWTGDVDHNQDGTKSISVTCNYSYGESTASYCSANCTITLSGNLTTIPRASSITSVSSGTTNYAPSVVFTPMSSTFKYKVQYSYGSWSYTSGFITPNSTNPYTYNSYTITGSTIAPYMTNSSSGTATATLYTYDANGTQIGYTDSKTFTITLNSSIVPTVSIGTLTEANATMQSLNWGVFVQNKSQLGIPITANGVYSSTISSIITTINGLSFSGSNITTSTLVTAGNNTISTTATDSRGRTATTTKTYTVVAYSNPQITTAVATRSLSDGTESDEGTYLKYSFVSSISPVSNHNAHTFRIGYKIAGSSTYTYTDIDTTNYSINKVDQVLNLNLSTSNTYDIIFEAVDSFMTSKINRQIDTGFDLLNFNANGKAMAIGKVSEAGANEEKLEVALLTNHTNQIILDTPTDIYSGMNINSSNRNEASIQYTKSSDITKSYVVGYGTAGYDGIGIYSHETGQNVFTVDKDGNCEIKSALRTKQTGNVTTQTLGTGLQIKEASYTEAPNNGLVLEYSRYSGWGGQLYIPDNGTGGIWYNGWDGGTRQNWRKLAYDDETKIERETASDGSYNVIKFADGTMIINQRIYVASYSGNYGLSSYIRNYPVSFVEPPFVTYSWYERSADVNHIIFRGAPSKTNPNGANNPYGGGANEVYTAFLGSATSSTGTIIYITSTGRWK